MLRQAAEKTDDTVGDGISTATNAVSVASILLLCEAVMTEIPVKEKESLPPVDSSQAVF